MFAWLRRFFDPWNAQTPAIPPHTHSWTESTSVKPVVKSLTITLPKRSSPMRAKRRWPQWMVERNAEICTKFLAHRRGKEPERAVPKLSHDLGLGERQIRNILKASGVWDK